MLIQELERQDRIQYSVGVKLVGSCLDRVDLEKEFYKKTSICVQFSMFRSCVKADCIDMLKFTHTSFKFIGFGFQFNRFWISCQKHRYIYLICILDSIHIQYTSKLFQYHVFVFRQVLEKTVFHFKIQVWKIPILV